MLTSRTIPQYKDRGESWDRFLAKVTKGSARATDIMDSADMAYMVGLSGVPTAPETQDLDQYADQFRAAFPTTPPESVQWVIDWGVQHDWFPHRFIGTTRRRNDDSQYQALWKKRATVEWTGLVNDAIITVLNEWTAANALACLDEETLDFDSRLALSGMLFLCLTWPHQ